MQIYENNAIAKKHEVINTLYIHLVLSLVFVNLKKEMNEYFFGIMTSIF